MAIKNIFFILFFFLLYQNLHSSQLANVYFNENEYARSFVLYLTNIDPEVFVKDIKERHSSKVLITNFYSHLASYIVWNIIEPELGLSREETMALKSPCYNALFTNIQLQSIQFTITETDAIQKKGYVDLLISYKATLPDLKKIVLGLGNQFAKQYAHEREKK